MVPDDPVPVAVAMDSKLDELILPDIDEAIIPKIGLISSGRPQL
jgi:hypothetical protein